MVWKSSVEIGYGAAVREYNNYYPVYCTYDYFPEGTGEDEASAENVLK